MGTESLVVQDVKAGEDLVRKLDEVGYLIEKAAWVYSAEDEEWRLILGLEPGASRVAAYDAALAHLTTSGTFDPNRLTIVNSDALDGFTLWRQRGGGSISAPFVESARAQRTYNYDTLGLNYEAAFVRALAEAIGDSATVSSQVLIGQHPVDVVVKSPTRTYLVEVKRTKRPLDTNELLNIVSRLGAAQRDLNEQAAMMVVVSHAGFTQNATEQLSERPGVRLVKWRPEEDSSSTLLDVIAS